MLTGIHDYRAGTGPWYHRPAAGFNGLAAQHPRGFSPVTLHFGPDAFSIYEVIPQAFNEAPRAPESRVRYILGSRKEQDFTISHHQPVTGGLTFDILFRSMNTIGYYDRQGSNQRNFSTRLAWRAPGGRYRIGGGYLSNRLNADENGGLMNDSTFEYSFLDSRSLVMQLGDATSERKNKMFFLSQELLLTKQENDSTGPAGTGISVYSHATGEQRHHRFSAGQSNDHFFPVTYYDTTGTHDSLRMRRLNAQLGLSLKNPGFLKGLGAGASEVYLHGTYERYAYRQSEIDTVIDDAGAAAGLKLIGEGGLRAEFSFSLNALNGEADLYMAEAHLARNWNGHVEVQLRLRSGRYLPGSVFSFYDSNHFRWSNNRRPEEQQSLEAEVRWNRGSHMLSASGGIRLFRAFAYFDVSALPLRNADAIRLYTTAVRHEVKWKSLHLANTVEVQQADPGSPLRVPALGWHGSLYYSGILFRGALEVQTGLACRMTSTWKADSYMPATGIFYLQEEKKIGGYPFIDVFASFRIRATRFFLKLDHLNAGWNGNTYYLMPHYPYPGRTLKLGIIWDFAG